MLRQLVVVTAVVTASGSAHADNAEQEPWEIISSLDDLHLFAAATTSVDLGASAIDARSSDDAASSHRAESALAATIDASVTLPYRNSSSFARTSATAAVRYGTDGPGVSFEQHGKLRPWSFELFEIATGDRLALDVAPKLSDRPDRWRRRYNATGFDADVIFLQYIGKRFGVQFCRCDNTFDTEIQLDGDMRERRLVETSDWSPITVTLRRDGEEVGRVDFIDMDARGINGEHSGVVINTWYPRIRNLELGPIALDFAYGRSATGWSQLSVDGQVVSTITSDQLPTLSIPAAQLHVTAKLGTWTGSAGVARGMYLAQDARLVVEDRATATFATKLGETSLTASAFAARSDIWTSKTDVSRHVTGGTALGAQYPLADGWALVGNAEVARTFYASLEGDLLPRVDTAVRVDLGIHRELGNWKR
jgi:hypothetical protein